MPAPKRIIYGGDGNSNMYFRENFDGKGAEFPAIHGSHFNPAQSLDRAALAHPNRANLIYGEQIWTVSESAKAARQIAELLLSCDVRSGERVVLISRNSPYHLLIHAACCRIGAVFVPISYRLQRRELAQMLQICTPSVVITDSETANEQKIFRQSEKSGKSANRDLKGYFFIDDDPQAPADSSVILQQFPAQPFAQAYRKFPGNLLSAAGGEISQFAASSRDDSKPGSLLLSRVKYAAGLAAILFTSGSAGVPKAVGLTHEQLYWGNQNLRDGFEYSTADTEIVVAPLTHIGGFNGTTLDLFSHGGTVVIMREFDPQKLLAQIERYRAAMMFGVPTIYAAMLNHPDFSKRDLSSFRLPLIGGAPAAASLLNRMAAAGLRPINVWGMTETSASGCCLSSENALRAVGSIGVPFPRIAARVVDPATGLDAENGVGELLLCGPSVITEYWNNPEATERAFIGQWLRTGDLVRVDSDGNFWVTGRIHNLINTGGEKVAPEEVERILSEYPGVSECTVVGIPDERWGEAIAAAFVMQAGKKLPSLPELHDFAAGKLAGYKIPKFVCELPEFPSTPNGKVDRAALAEILGKS